MSGQELKVTNCVFRYVWCKIEGGSITANDKFAVATISTTGFTLCYTAANGAGIDYEGLRLNVSRCCFLGCRAIQSGQAVYFYGFKEGDNVPYGVVEYTCIEQCAPFRTRGARESIFLSYGLEFVQFFNSTSNHINEFGSCFVSAHTNGIGLHYSNFMDCTGGNCFWFHNTKKEDQIEKCNVVRNAAKKETGIFAFENGTTTITDFIFRNNRGAVYFVTGPVILQNCRFDIHLTSYTFYHCIHEIVNVSWSQDSITTYPLPYLITWGCWARGKPSPTASKSLPPLEYAQENATPGMTIFLILMLLGGIVGFSVFSVCNKTEERIHDSGEQNVAIGDN